MERLWPLSADHGYGYQDLLDGLEAVLPAEVQEQELPEGTVRLAFLGRPNVGKSSMINTIIGQERMVVSEIAGTTRDSVDTLLTHGKYSYLLIDTAGIRRKGKTTDKLEKFSILKALGSLSRCHIALVLIDAGAGRHRAGYHRARLYPGTEPGLHHPGQQVGPARRAIPQRQKQLMEEIAAATTFMSFAPVLKVSALTGQGIKRLFPGDRPGRPPVQRAVPHQRPEPVAGRCGGEAFASLSPRPAAEILLYRPDQDRAAHLCGDRQLARWRCIFPMSATWSTSSGKAWALTGCRSGSSSGPRKTGERNRRFWVAGAPQFWVAVKVKVLFALNIPNIWMEVGPLEKKRAPGKPLEPLVFHGWGAGIRTPNRQSQSLLTYH